MNAKLEKELKRPDEFVSWGTRAAQYASENAVLVLGGAIVVVVLLASMYAWNKNRDLREVEAARQLYAGEKLLEGDLKGMSAQFRGMGIAGLGDAKPEDQEKAITEFQEIANEFPGTKAARRAYVKTGDTYLAMKKYDEAAAAYEKGIGGTPVERYYALSGRAHALEAKEAYDDAASSYRRIVEDEKAIFRDHAALDLSRALAAAGKEDEARSILSSFAEDHPDSPLKTEADTNLMRLGGTPVARSADEPPADDFDPHAGHDHP